MTDTGRFERFLRPASVAIVGASPQRGSPRNTLLRVLQKHGFPGRIYPVPATARSRGCRRVPRSRNSPRPPTWRS